MRKDKLGEFYDRFDPDERFRLVLEAAARGDEEEIERLRETCPRETYTASDIAFTDRISGSLKITMMLCQLLAPSLTELRTLISLSRGPLPYLRPLHQHSTSCLPKRPWDGHDSRLGGRRQKGGPTDQVAEGGDTGGGQPSDGSGTGRPARNNGPFEGSDRRFLAK